MLSSPKKRCFRANRPKPSLAYTNDFGRNKIDIGNDVNNLSVALATLFARAFCVDQKGMAQQRPQRGNNMQKNAHKAGLEQPLMAL